jgi:CRISPR/Cas system CMR subunit Cmr4 (Cas7 group RAMP superfamily)
MSRTKFTFDLISKSRIHVGAGFARVQGVDAPIFRRRNRCVIPGTTLKGLLRTALYRIAPVLEKTACWEIKPDKMKLCSVCELLGMPNLPSKVFVEDAHPIAGVDVLLATRTAINRASGKVSEGALFTSEYVAPGTKFTFSVEACDLDADQTRLLLYGFLEMAESGFGRMRQKMTMHLHSIDGEFPQTTELERLKSLLEAEK